MKKIVDGNVACSTIAYSLSEVCPIYPITPSSTMAENVEIKATNMENNLFGQSVECIQMQSESGVAGALHGAAQTARLTSTFTSSQGLLLMIPEMYKLAGQNLPTVFHVSSRTVASHALCIFGDHSDVMATRQTGFIMLNSTSVQECQDIALAAHILALKCSMPVMHFFDGFTTSHQLCNIEAIDDESIKKIFPHAELEKFRARALSTNNPIQRGTAQNSDVFFQNREKSMQTQGYVYDKLTQVFADIKSITKRAYSPFEYYGANDAESIIVTMGSSFQTCQSVVNELSLKGQKVGVLLVRLYRPFFAKEFVEALPKSTRIISVLDKTKENINGEPLFLDVSAAILKSKKNIEVIGGRYGLGGKELLPEDILAVYQNSFTHKKDNFTLSIIDDVCNNNLEVLNIKMQNEKEKSIAFYGFGSDGTVSATKSTIKILGEKYNNIQGFFEYDSKKSGSLTKSYIRVSKEEIKNQFSPKKYNFVIINNFSFIKKYEFLENLTFGGTVLLNCPYSCENINEFLPNSFIEGLQDKKANFYIINANLIAQKYSLKGKINTIMQTAFFNAFDSNNFEDNLKAIKHQTENAYSKKGELAISNNLSAISDVPCYLCKVDTSKVFAVTLNSSNTSENNINSSQNSTSCSNCTANCSLNKNKQTEVFFENIIKPIESLQGNNLKVSQFNIDGTVPTDTSKFLKRGIATHLPCFDKEKCIQCGLCVLACPHGALSGVYIDDEENCTDKNFLNSCANAIGAKGKYKVQLSPLDCTGCGVCQSVCPAMKNAIELKSAQSVDEESNYNASLLLKSKNIPFNMATVKGLQFKTPYFSFSGACAGCGETPYIKLLTQLFGERLLIANATGCSSIYGASYPVCPYGKDEDGFGPSFVNSLFEDNAEFALGILLGEKSKQKHMQNMIQNAIKTTNDDIAKKLLQEYCISDWTDKQKVVELVQTLKAHKNKSTLISKILENSNDLLKKSVWAIGGDGWAYDIGYGGLDHAVHSGENINILVLDTEGYSNTGGQSSKATSAGAVMKFSSKGKKTNKKDLSAILMSGKNCYVAQINISANPAHAIKTLLQAEKYNGPSVVICYCPCVSHGYDMKDSVTHAKQATACNYFNLFNFNPSLEQDNFSQINANSFENVAEIQNKDKAKSFLKTEPRFAKTEKFENGKNLIDKNINNLKKMQKYLDDQNKAEQK